MTPWEIDGRKYVIAAIGTSDWARNARATGQGTLTSGRTRTHVPLSEVTDPALKERVVTSFGTVNRAGGSFLVQAGVTPERTPAGFAAAVPHTAVFEVTRPDRAPRPVTAEVARPVEPRSSRWKCSPGMPSCPDILS